MEAYAGFEPAVGEIRALRSFRIGPGGVLYPLFHNQPWTDGTNSAQCRTHAVPDPGIGTSGTHHPPEPDCSCGFYAYAAEPGAAEAPYARYVLAVVACWGRVIAGTRGVRAEHSRIEALWLSHRVPAELAASVIERYPSAKICPDKAALLADHPPTRLDCYEQPDRSRPRLRHRALWLLIALFVVGTSVPLDWVANRDGHLVLGSVGVVLLVIGTARFARHPRSVQHQRQAMLTLAALLWVLAPLAGWTGILLLRLPLLQVACLTYLQLRMLNRAARQFPAAIGSD